MYKIYLILVLAQTQILGLVSRFIVFFYLNQESIAKWKTLEVTIRMGH